MSLSDVMIATSSDIWKDKPLVRTSRSCDITERYCDVTQCIVHCETLSVLTLKVYLLILVKPSQLSVWMKKFGHGEHVTGQVWMETRSENLHYFPSHSQPFWVDSPPDALPIIYSPSHHHSHQPVSLMHPAGSTLLFSTYSCVALMITVKLVIAQLGDGLKTSRFREMWCLLLSGAMNGQVWEVNHPPPCNPLLPP